MNRKAYAIPKKLFRRGRKTLRKLARYHFDLFPRNVLFVVTNRCNLRCEFCGQGKTAWRREEELTLQDYRSVIDEIAAMKNTTVSFTGGEVFVYRDFVELLEYCHEREVRIGFVLTNGTLCSEERTLALIDSKVERLGFSLDGTEEVHDRIRGVKGSFRKTIDTILAVDSVKKARGIDQPGIWLNFVLIDDNLDHVEPFVDEMLNLDATIEHLSFQYLTYIRDDKLQQHKKCMQRMNMEMPSCYWDGFRSDNSRFDTDKWMGILENLKGKTQDRLEFVFSYDLTRDEVEKWYHDNDAIFDRCGFVRDHFLILPNGDYPLCDFIRSPVGNVKERSLRDLWKDEKAVAFRKRVDKTLLPGCERCCQLKKSAKRSR